MAAPAFLGVPHFQWPLATYPPPPEQVPHFAPDDAAGGAVVVESVWLCCAPACLGLESTVTSWLTYETDTKCGYSFIMKLASSVNAM